MLVAPVSRTSIAVGKTLSGCFQSMLQGGIILGLSFLVDVDLTILIIIKVLGIIFLASFALTSLGLLIASRMGSFEGFNIIMNFLIMPMFLLSGAFFPLGQLPIWMKTVVSVIGTRPEVIKVAPVVLELRKHPDEFRSLVLATAQHREMLDQMLEIFGLVPDHDLDVMTAGQSLTDVTNRVLAGVGEFLDPNPCDGFTDAPFGESNFAVSATIYADGSVSGTFMCQVKGCVVIVQGVFTEVGGIDQSAGPGDQDVVFLKGLAAFVDLTRDPDIGGPGLVMVAEGEPYIFEFCAASLYWRWWYAAGW